MRFSPRPAVLSALALLLALPLSPALGQRPQTGESRVKMPTGVAISPDGATVAWALAGSGGSALHVTAVNDPDPAKEKLVSPNGATGCASTSPVWSPDSATLAFTSTCTSKEEKPGQEQIFLWSRASGTVRQLTHVTGLFKHLAWSPDGKTLAFLFVENATRSAGALDAMKPWSGVIGEDNLEIQGVYGVEVASGKGAWIVAATPDMYTFEFAWAPNGKELAFISAKAPGENNWWVAKLYTQTIESHSAIPRVAFDPNTTETALHGLQIAVPRWSPDGKRIAFIGGLMSDQGSTGGDVWVVDAKGGQPVDVTPGIDGTPSYEGWFSNKEMGFVEDRRGHTEFIAWNPETKAPESNGVLDLGEASVSGGAIKDAVSVARNGTAAFVKSGFDTPPEIWLESNGGFQQMTHLNAGAKPSGKTISLEWENEGFHVQGWLTYPANYNPAKKYPLIVQVHGGPSSSIGSRWGGGSLWSDAGYFEFQPNPRGSFGQGEKFTQANIKDFGYGDLRDILAGVDAVEKKVSIDDKRLGLTGWSYGGFMSMFASTQTQRFAAIVAGAGISDWQSYYGENSIDQWMIPFFGASVYDDPAVYAKSSAITFIKKSKTPMLIIVGDRDGECPAPQSFEMWHALRDLGVKTQLVVYPDEGHGFRNPAHIKDRSERELKWFAQYMPAK